MNYITHHRFKTIAACGERLNLPYGTKIIEDNGWLLTDNKRPICFCTSENSKMHFARDDDGNGLERGKLTYAIAYAKRGNGYRFTDEERNMLVTEYRHWIRQDCDMLLFNNDFFNADVSALRELADKLAIKIRE